jgi:hypothetical protein
MGKSVTMPELNNLLLPQFMLYFCNLVRSNMASHPGQILTYKELDIKETRMILI